jgi:hypothetical protein
MPRPSLFNFEPLRKKKDIATEGPYVRVTKAGSVHISRNNLERLVGNSSNPFIVAVYYDAVKRAVGFRVHKESVKLALPENYRLVKPYVTAKDVHASFSIRNIMKTLNDVVLPFKATLNVYKDSQYGELHYFIVPQKSSESTSNEVEKQ